jgi:hypothetical protein
MASVEGVHLVRTEENRAEVDALAERAGGRVGLAGVLADLDRRGRRTWAPGLAVRRAFTWDAEDRRTPNWWPQGVSTSADAEDDEVVAGRRLVVVSWYAKDDQGSRLSVVDLDTLEYGHVLLVVPDFDEDGDFRIKPLRVHAGGVVWRGRHVHVAATAKGIITCHLDDLVRSPDPDLGYRYLLPVRFSYQAWTDEGHERMRYSFLSLDRSGPEPALLAGEYARGDQTRRLIRYRIDPSTGALATAADGIARPLMLDDTGVGQMQGAVSARGAFHVTVSHGPWCPGSLYVGRPGSFKRRRFATPMGPEDIAWWPSTDLLWAVSEHPRRRWVFAMRRPR